MTVAELIKALAALDPDMKVIAEGCDCANLVTEVTVEGRSPVAWLAVDMNADWS